MYLVKRSLSSTESALFLRDLYDKEFIKPNESLEEHIFGPVIKRKEETTNDFSSFDIVLEEYLRFDIKKFFGITINEFLSLTLYEKDILLLKAKDAMERLSKELSSIENDINTQSKGLKDEDYNEVLDY